MNYLTIVILIFAVIGGIDRIFGNRLGIGKEFEKAFMLLGVMALSMIGMIVISPLIADLLVPVSKFVSEIIHIDPSIIPASLFANDMGGAPLANEMAVNSEIGAFNAMVLSSMLGCTISFTIPFALGVVPKEYHSDLLFGLLCGVVTIPLGLLVSGIIVGISFKLLIINLIPIIIFSGIIAVGLLLFPEICVKIFNVFGVIIKIIVTVGLVLGIINFLSGKEIIKGIATFEEGAYICFNAAVVLSGTFPFMFILSKVLKKPLLFIGKKTGLNSESVLGIFSSLATSATAFGMMDKMNKKGIVLNSAFAVSGAFTVGSHLAFTMAFDNAYILPVIVGKLVAGVTALIVASLVFKKSVDKI